MKRFYLIRDNKVKLSYDNLKRANNGFNRFISRYPKSIIRLYDSETKDIIKQYYPVELYRQIK